MEDDPTTMDEIDRFTTKWQEVENEVIRRAHMTDGHGFVKAFSYLVGQDSLLAQKASLVDDLRALRNIYSHRDRARYIAELESHVFKDLDEIYELVVHPPTVLDKFGCNVYAATLGDSILEVMDTMSEKVFTHVPVLDSGRLIGVFTYNSFFEWAHDVLNERVDATFEKKQIRDINRKYILPPTVYYDCVKSDLPAGNVDSIFREMTKQQKRLDCIFITDDGKKNAPIRGIITPWDLYKVW